jgi:hypothetical protein
MEEENSWEAFHAGLKASLAPTVCLSTTALLAPAPVVEGSRVSWLRSIIRLR